MSVLLNLRIGGSHRATVTFKFPIIRAIVLVNSKVLHCYLPINEKRL